MWLLLYIPWLLAGDICACDMFRLDRVDELAITESYNKSGAGVKWLKLTLLSLIFHPSLFDWSVPANPTHDHCSLRAS